MWQPLDGVSMQTDDSKHSISSLRALVVPLLGFKCMDNVVIEGSGWLFLSFHVTYGIL